jgi:hypothetical protein
MHQSRGEIETPLHPAGESTRVIVAATFQPDEVQQLADPAFEYRSAHTIDASKKAQIFRRGQHRVDRDVLGRNSNHAAYGLGLRAYAVIGQLRITARRRSLRGYDRDYGGLSRAIGAEQTKDFSLTDVETDPCHSIDLTVALLKRVDS